MVVIPVSDVDRAKEFYANLGWRLDADYDNGSDFRVTQFTPTGSGCSVIFGKNVTAAEPGSAQGLYLVVSDVAAARKELLGRGVKVSEVFHMPATCTPGRMSPSCLGGSGSVVRIPIIAATVRSPRSMIRTATAGCSGDHDAASRSCHRRHQIPVGERIVAGVAPRRSRARGTREADGASRPELGGLVRRVHGARAVRRGAAQMNGNEAVSREPQLAGQTVVVLGGSSGIGLETAKQARSAGARSFSPAATRSASSTPRASSAL